MNLLPRAARRGPRDSLTAPALSARPGETGEIWCGIRPEDMDWLPRRARPAAVAGTALTVEPLGPDTLVAMTVAGAKSPAACRRAVSRQPGEAVTLAIDPARLHLFDRESGNAIQ